MSYDVLLTVILMLPSRGVAIAPAVAPSRPIASLTATAAPEHLTNFENCLARVEWSSQGWRLVAGGVTLKDFGRRESEARLGAATDPRTAAEPTRNYRRHPTPSLEYWLSDGAPPRGPAVGLRMAPIDASSLRVEQITTQWVLRDNKRELFNFGADEGGARQALNVIQKYRFTEVGAVNPAAPSMIIFIAPPTALSLSDPAPASDPLASSVRQLPPHPFVVASAPIAPAVPPLRQLGLFTHIPSATSPTPDRIPFDWRQVQLRKEGDGWRLAAGSCVLADFGADQRAARQGFAAMQYYHFTERYRIGDGAAHFTYFQVGGQPPHGVMFGLVAQPFQLNRLQVRQVNGHWTVCEDAQPLVEMGDKAEDAKRVLELIKRQCVDRLCRIGAAEGGGMSFLVRSR